MLTEQEKKIVALALDPAAAKGEIENCAVKLVMLWRKRKVTVEDFEPEQPEDPDGTNSQAMDYGAFVIPFGKHVGHAIADIPRSYLSWLLGSMNADPDKKKFKDLREAIEAFLKK